jgi:hypothetical protein
MSPLRWSAVSMQRASDQGSPPPCGTVAEAVATAGGGGTEVLSAARADPAAAALVRTTRARRAVRLPVAKREPDRMRFLHTVRHEGNIQGTSGRTVATDTP